MVGLALNVSEQIEARGVVERTKYEKKQIG
jgi:hypothetical protein